jgi:hypothetical protein
MLKHAWKIGAISLAVIPQTFAQTDTAKPMTPKPPMETPATTPNVMLYRLKDVVDLDLRNEADKSAGEIDALLIDPTNGSIVYALVGKGGVLGIGEKEHLIPWEKIQILPKDGSDDKVIGKTALSVEQIERAPVYKSDAAIDIETERMARTSVGLSGDGLATRTTRLISTKDIDDCKVIGSDDNKFEIEQIVLAPREGAIAYIVIDAGSKKAALPWSMVQARWDKDKDLELRSAVTKERLTSAPAYDDKDWKRMRTGAWVQELSTFHSTDPFWKRSVNASAPRSTNQ